MICTVGHLGITGADHSAVGGWLTQVKQLSAALFVYLNPIFPNLRRRLQSVTQAHSADLLITPGCSDYGLYMILRLLYEMYYVCCVDYTLVYVLSPHPRERPWVVGGYGVLETLRRW